MERTDGCLAAGSTIHGGNLQETVGIDLKGGNELSLATGHGRNTSELELAEQTIVTALGAFSLITSDEVSMRISSPRR